MNPRRPRAWARVAILAAAVTGASTLFTGCGSTTTSGSPDGASTCATQAPGVSAKQIKIGLIYPDSGPAGIAALFLGARSAVEGRIALQNSQGGVNGRRIDLVWGDDRSDTTQFATLAHDQVDNQHVFSLISESVAGDDSLAWLRTQNVPVTGVATSPAWNQNPNLFQIGSLFDPGGVSTFGDYVKAQGGTKALIVTNSSIPAAKNLADQLTHSLTGSGVTVLGETDYDAGTASPDHAAATITSSGANALVDATLTDGFVDLYARAKAGGAKINVALSTAGNSVSELAHQGSTPAGLSVGSIFVSTDSPAMAGYKAAMANYAPELTNADDELTLNGYVAADEMIEGLRLAGACPTRANFIQNLRKVTDYTGQGLTPATDLSKQSSPDACLNFLKVNPGGGVTQVKPPAAFDQNGFWCGQSLS
jgi:branched-chain amino acid transport system substrate-binding protein